MMTLMWWEHDHWGNCMLEGKFLISLLDLKGSHWRESNMREI